MMAPGKTRNSEKKYETRATEITVGPSETQNAQLRAIPAEDLK